MPSECWQQLVVDARLKVKALGVAAGHHLDQILVAGLVFAQKHKVAGGVVDAADLVKAGARRNIHLTSDDRANPVGFCLFVEVDGSVHCSVVGDGYRLLSQLLCPLHQLLDPARAVEQAVFTVDMKMNKLIFHSCIPPFTFSEDRRRFPRPSPALPAG